MRGVAAIFGLISAGLSACASTPFDALPSPFSEQRDLSPAQTMSIERVVTPGGLDAWLVSDPAVPIIAINAGVIGGASLDPPGKYGASPLAAAAMRAGAGPYDEAAFQTRLDELNMSLGFGASRDFTFATMTTLSENRDEAFELLRIALNEPRFDPKDVERLRDQTLIALKRSDQSPGSKANRRLMSELFADHPYGRRVSGTHETVASLIPDDLRRAHKSMFPRDQLRIVVVGDIDAETLAPLIDNVFGALPEQSEPRSIPAVSANDAGKVHIIPFATPQTTVYFAAPGIDDHDPDFIPAVVMNYILGGGGSEARLTRELRSTRGLTYAVRTGLSPLEASALFTGSFTTENARAGEAIGVLKTELRKMYERGVTAQELRDAKLYLTGSYPLAFDSNAKIAGQLIALRLSGRGIDFVNHRNAMMEAVSLSDIDRAARRLLNPDAFTFVVVGQPEGLE